MDKIKYIKERGEIKMIKECGTINVEERVRDLTYEINSKRNDIIAREAEIAILEEELHELGKI